VSHHIWVSKDWLAAPIVMTKGSDIVRIYSCSDLQLFGFTVVRIYSSADLLQCGFTVVQIYSSTDLQFTIVITSK
jgi:hypothetical protein